MVQLKLSMLLSNHPLPHTLLLTAHGLDKNGDELEDDDAARMEKPASRRRGFFHSSLLLHRLTHPRRTGASRLAWNVQLSYSLSSVDKLQKARVA